MSHYGRNDSSFGLGAAVIGGILFVVLLLSLAFSVARVDAGNICVTTSGGAVQGVAESGWGLKAPWKSYKCYYGRVIVMESVADNNKDGLISRDDTDSGAQYINPAISGKSVDGLDFSVSYVVRYQLVADEEQIQAMYSVGAKNTDQVNELLVKAPIRSIVPEMVNTLSADDLYLGNLGPINKKISERLAATFEPYGIRLIDFGLKKPDFVDSYEQAIADKALKVEETKREELAQQLATEQAVTLRIRTEGEQAAAVLQAEREAETSVIAAQAEAERVVIASQAEADRLLLSANAEAEANNLVGASLAANPELLEWEQIQAIRSADVIYLPADGVLPIMEVATPEADE